MLSFEYFQFPYLSDNYGVLVHAPSTGETLAIDAGDGDAYLNALKETGWKLTHLLITHHHWDHTDGLEKLKSETGCKVIGPHEKSGPIAGLDKKVSEGDQISFGGQNIEVLNTPGHTLDMINFYLPEEQTIFAADTLFTLGCGRVFEGSKEMMWESLKKLSKLPADTIVYSSHEYTAANLKFALSIDPNNKKLQERNVELNRMLAENKPTVPSLLAEELATNPFLRPDDVNIRKHLGMELATDSEVFVEIRTRKDNF